MTTLVRLDFNKIHICSLPADLVTTQTVTVHLLIMSISVFSVHLY